MLRRGTASARRRLRNAVGALLTRAAPVALRLLPAISVVPLRRDGMDPIPRLGRLRERSPVSRIPVPLRAGAWLVTGYEQAREVLAAPSTTFSTDYLNFARAVGLPSQNHPGGLGFTDPPEHTRLRRVLTPEFTGRRLQRLVPRIEAVVAEQLDALAEQSGPVDLVSAFAFPVPSLAICELLGVPYEERADFQRLSTSRFDLADGANAAVGAVESGVDYLLRIIRQQRVAPGDGLLGRLVRDHGDEFTDRELAGLADGLLTGGLETTASTIAMGALLLMQNPELFEQIRTDDAAVEPFVEELLRYLSVVQVAFPRVALKPVRIGDREVKPGAVVVCSLSAANRDPALRPDADRFDPSLPSTRHLAFGHGIHRCVGAELGKIELRAALPALVRRFPHLRLAADAGSLPFRRSSIVHGIDSLPVRLGPPAG
ncbi:cytochrome P450 [Pseudonocardia humida]|uniref:Cytochrome P450 n=1 Tax=Pseudonocardia humida TaxID=2800819 RepID=A0ABT1A6G5_9PSEU|nr:cytochrome P450 [Pseudonocardia humida]MCO1658590.1 cytochrome P450 [Pseudonocardia humida]